MNPGKSLDVGRAHFLALMILALLIPVSFAQAAEEGISVTGTATVKARPTVIEITGTISGEGELANDAVVKFRDSKKKVIAAFDNLKNPDLTVSSDNSDIHDSVDPMQQMRMMQGQSTEQPKVRVQISQKIRLTLKNVDKLENDKLMDAVLKLVDTSRDAGLNIGAGPVVYNPWQGMQNNNESLVQFKIPDTNDLQTQACKEAIENARTKAQRIADLSGLKLGKVLSVHDVSVTDAHDNNGNYNYNPYFPNNNSGERQVDKEATASSLGDIPITVHLQVQFEIEK
jgi:uncharacterized protein YggE